MKEQQIIKFSIKQQIASLSNSLEKTFCRSQDDQKPIQNTFKQLNNRVSSEHFVKTVNREIRIESNLLSHLRKGIQLMRYSKQKKTAIKNSSEFYYHKSFTSQSARRNQAKKRQTMRSIKQSTELPGFSENQRHYQTQSSTNSPIQYRMTMTNNDKENRGTRSTVFKKNKNFYLQNPFPHATHTALKTQQSIGIIQNRQFKTDSQTTPINIKQKEQNTLAIQGTIPQWKSFECYHVLPKKSKIIKYVK